MKGRVSNRPRYRELRMVGWGAQDIAEHGPGALHRLHLYAQAATGAPVTAQEYDIISKLFPVLRKTRIVRCG